MTCYERGVNELKLSGCTRCNVVGFNYRGVRDSTSAPECQDDLVTDGIAQVQRLLNQGVPPGKIHLKAHSLGGADATLVAKHFHRHGIEINLCAQSTFSSLTNFVVGQIRTLTGVRTPQGKTGHYETFLLKLLGWICKPLIKFALSLVKWEMEVGDAYKELLPTHKEYMVVRSSKARRKELGVALRDDPVIPHYASLHMDLQDERREDKAKLDKQVRKATKLAGSLGLFAGHQAENAVLDLLEARKMLKIRKMEAPAGANGHNVPNENLHDRYHQQTASHFFRGFVQRTRTRDLPVRKSTRSVV